MVVLQEKSKKSCMDYGFHMAVTKWNDKVIYPSKKRHKWGQHKRQVSQDMETLVNAGINSFKFFMAYKVAARIPVSFLAFIALQGSLMVTDEELLFGFDRCKELGALPMVMHCIGILIH